MSRTAVNRTAVRRTCLYGAAGGALAGPVFGVGAFIFSDAGVIRQGHEALDLNAFVEALLILPFALTGALICAYVAFFGHQELRRFSKLWKRGFRVSRPPGSLSPPWPATRSSACSISVLSGVRCMRAC